MSTDSSLSLFAKRLKQLRSERRLTTKQVGQVIGKDAKTVSGWEHDRSNPDVKTLDALALFFNCSVDYLLGRTDIRVDEKLLELVNGTPPELLEEKGNVLDALNERKKRLESLDEELINYLICLTKEQQRFLIHVVKSMLEEQNE